MEDNYDYYLEFTNSEGKKLILPLDEYQERIRPLNLYENTSPEELYTDWKQFDASLGHLESALEAFQNDEMYEHCHQIKRLINEKKERIKNY
jgi:hypothetical protein